MNPLSVRKKLLSFFIISLAIAFEGFLILTKNEDVSLFLMVFSYIFSILILQVVVLFLSSKIGKNTLFIFIAIFISCNSFILKLSFFESFQKQSPILLIFVFSIFALFLYVFIRMISQKEWAKSIVGIVVVSLVLVPVFAHINLGGGKQKGSAERSFEDWIITFRNKPNIHIISFDSLVPQSTTSKYLGIDKIFYDDFIEKHMLNVDMSFAPRVPSKESLNALMNLDQETVEVKFGYFAGRHRSIVSTIAEVNGYDLVTGYSGDYFGEIGSSISSFTKGDVPLENSSLCLGADSGAIKLRMYGICKILGNFSSLTNLIGLKSTQLKWPAKVLDKIAQVSKIGKPQITLHYIYHPIGHTPLTYQHYDLEQRSAYKAFFLKWSGEMPAILEGLQVTIEKNDPNALVMIFGDHGAYLSRGLDYNDNNEFVIRDRHMVELAVLKTENQCATQEQLFYYSQDYATPSRVLTAMFRCLSDEPDKLDKLVMFSDKLLPCDASSLQQQLKLSAVVTDAKDECFYVPE